MASKLIIPEVLNHYNVYNDQAKKLIGISGEIDLGELEAITDTIEGTGILGEIEDPVTGAFESTTIKFKWACLHRDLFADLAGFFAFYPDADRQLYHAAFEKQRS